MQAGPESGIDFHAGSAHNPHDMMRMIKAKGEGGMGQDQDDLVVMPLLAYQRRIAGNRDVSTIYVSVDEGRPTALVKDQITSLMRGG